MIAQRGIDAQAISLAPLFLDWAHAAFAPVNAAQFEPALCIVDGIPPPREAHSLLSLHCALTL